MPQSNCIGVLSLKQHKFLTMKIKALKGVRDILSQEIEKWNFIEQKAQQKFSAYGYAQIKTPIIEESRLFTRSIGQETDIIEKEMYTFVDRGNRKIALRPEATASVARAYLEHNLDQKGLVKLYYSGPMFRGEKPQSGRNRQFYQIGIEALGCYSPYLDVEIIHLAVDYLHSLGLRNFKLLINTVGSATDKTNYSRILRAYLKNKLSELCESCQKRFERNTLRILDCKHKSCQKIIKDAPKIHENLSKQSSSDFLIVKNNLDKLKIDYTVMPALVRGLDYYTKTVFEIAHDKLGAKNTILAGGRYDNLIEDLGGKPTGCAGFALGVERLLLVCDAEHLNFAPEEKITVYAIGLDECSFEEIFKLTHALRKNDIPTYVNFEQRSLKSQIRQADRLKCRYVLIMGENELKAESILLKDMKYRTQELISLDEIVLRLKNLITVKND